MHSRSTLIAALLAALLLTGSVAFATADDEAPDAPTVVDPTRAVDPQVEASLAIFRKPATPSDAIAPEEAAEFTEAVSALGVNPLLARLSQTRGVAKVYLVPSNEGVCILVVATQSLDGAGGTCLTAEMALNGTGYLVGQTRTGIAVTGVLPDGATGAQLLFSDGSQTQIDIVNNVYTADVSRGISGVQFTINGEDRRLDIPFEPEPVSEERNGEVVRIR